MDVYTDSIQHLPVAEKLRLVERIWDDVASSPEGIPIPAWAMEEAQRRRDEMIANPEIGVPHEQIWQRIRKERDA
jgi:putative addiction module component (TIGR02574 family)